MPAYPDLPVLGNGFSQIDDDGLAVTKMSDGSIRGQIPYPHAWRDLVLVHSNISAQQWLDLCALYEANINAIVTYTDAHTGEQLELMFVRRPQRVGAPTGPYFTVRVELRGRVVV